MKSYNIPVSAVVLAIGLLASTASALNIETVTVGNTGNVADSRYGGYGSVSYTYNIGKYEVTAGQYTAFLNAVAKTDSHGLYSTEMWGSELGCKIQRTGESGNYSYSVASDQANRPVNYVSYWDACRFTNWLHNGQGNGDTETGSYTLNDYTGSDGRTISRNPDATWVMPTEDEWYKAAFYKGGSTNAGYWDYSTRSDSMNTGMANYGNAVGHATDVGTYGAYPSPYGTYDQGGNVWEWNDGVVYEYDTWSERGRRGGSFGQDGHMDIHLLASNRSSGAPMNDSAALGFRVVEVPEPGTITLIALGGLTMLRKRQRREN